MKKVWCTLLAVVLTCCWMMLPASAVDRALPLVVDKAGVLSSEELAALNEKADTISEQYQCEIAVVYVETLNGANVMDYADDFYDYNGYGYGAEDDGFLLLVAMEERQYWMTGYHYGSTVFDEYNRDRVEESIYPSLSSGNWYSAANDFLDSAETILYEATAPKTVSPVWIVIDLILGFLLSMIPVGVMKAQLHPVAQSYEASEYVAKNGINLMESKDIFLRREVRRRPIERKRDSSQHTSSSGRSHTGSGGSF